CDGLCCRGQQRQHHAPHFVEADLKINTVEYVHILEEVLFPWMDEKFCLDNVVLIQDSAP
ncbi:Putative LOC100197594, partial [Caligus rogercresseyi]